MQARSPYLWSHTQTLVSYNFPSELTITYAWTTHTHTEELKINRKTMGGVACRLQEKNGCALLLSRPPTKANKDIKFRQRKTTLEVSCWDA